VVEFGAELHITYVMGGLAREFGDRAGLVLSWLEQSAESGMPVDPRIWAIGAPRSSYPACIAVKAAFEQGADAGERYLRALREGFMCRRRKLDAPHALIEEARHSGLDGERFRIDLESNATLEAFAQDLEQTRAFVAASPAELPILRFESGWVGRADPYESWRAAAIEAGASPSGDPLPDVPAALGRFGRMATAELVAVCDLPGPRAGAEVWRLASEWRVRRLPVLAGELWELA
jgi:putative protein-disulfide isomerase